MGFSNAVCRLVLVALLVTTSLASPPAPTPKPELFYGMYVPYANTKFSQELGHGTLRLPSVARYSRVFLVKEEYNCSTAPTGYKTGTGIVTYQRNVTLKIDDVPPGRYKVCISNTTAVVPLTSYKTIRQKVTVSGAIDPLQSNVCCNTGQAGNNTWCTIYANDQLGFPAGIGSDACGFSFTTLLDGDGSAIATYTQPRFSSTGVFVFTVHTIKSGCSGRIAVAYNGYILGNRLTHLQVKPAKVEKSKGTSVCYALISGDMMCVVTKRDRYNNPILHCNVTMSTGDMTCYPVTE